MSEKATLEGLGRKVENKLGIIREKEKARIFSGLANRFGGLRMDRSRLTLWAG